MDGPLDILAGVEAHEEGSGGNGDEVRHRDNVKRRQLWCGQIPRCSE